MVYCKITFDSQLKTSLCCLYILVSFSSAHPPSSAPKVLLDLLGYPLTFVNCNPNRSDISLQHKRADLVSEEEEKFVANNL